MIERHRDEARAIATAAIAEITIAGRHRKEMGDLGALAESIKSEGLLQPIGITSDSRLVFGERRLRACADILGWTEIDVRVVNVTSILSGEYAENEIRKDFTPTERLAIAEAVKAELGQRKGQRTDLQRVDDGPHVAGKTRDLAAKRAGFGSGKQLERAASVVARGVPKLVEKMDAGKISISAAAKISKAEPQVQARVIELPSAQIQAETRRIKAEEDRIREVGRQTERDKGSNAYTKYLIKNGRFPAPEEAKTIAKLDGKITPDDRGKRHSPLPPPTKEDRERKKREDEYDNQLWRVRQALGLCALNTEEPSVLILHASSIDADIIDGALDAGYGWLRRFVEEWLRRGK